MKLGHAVSSVFFDGAGFNVSFHRGVPSITQLSIVIGWAKIAQRKAGLTCFAISNVRGNLYFEPAKPDELEKLQRDLIVLLEAIGFETAEIAFMESSTVSLPTSTPAKVAASKRLLNA